MSTRSLACGCAARLAARNVKRKVKTVSLNTVLKVEYPDRPTTYAQRLTMRELLRAACNGRVDDKYMQYEALIARVT